MSRIVRGSTEVPSFPAKPGRTLVTKEPNPVNEDRETRMASSPAPRRHASFGGEQNQSPRGNGAQPNAGRSPKEKPHQNGLTSRHREATGGGRGGGRNERQPRPPRDDLEPLDGTHRSGAHRRAISPRKTRKDPTHQGAQPSKQGKRSEDGIQSCP